MLSAIWENLTSDPILDIRTIRSPKEAFRYLIKYILKPPSFPCVENYVDFLRCFEHKPLIVSFGELRCQQAEIEVVICRYCGSGIFFFVCIVDEHEVEEWLNGYVPP